MFTALSTMLQQAFTMITMLFGAGEKLAKSGDNLATWCEESTGTFVDEARIDRKIKQIRANRRAQLTELEEAARKVLPAPEDALVA